MATQAQATRQKKNTLRDVLNHELLERHGYGMLHSKLKPVHLANALMRSEHRCVGDMHELKLLLAATKDGNSDSKKIQAVEKLIDRSRERWGRLGEGQDLGASVLVQRVLPLLREIISTDKAAWGESPEQSSFSSPTALTATRDPSDEHAGEFVFTLWSQDMEGTGRNALLTLWHRLTEPKRELHDADDLTVLLAPLSEKSKDYQPTERERGDLSQRSPSERERQLWTAAKNLAAYEEKLQSNPIASLQRIATLATLTIYFHALSRPHDWLQLPQKPLLLDATLNGASVIAQASTRTVQSAHRDASAYTQALIEKLLQSALTDEWAERPDDALRFLMEQWGAEDYATKAEGRALLPRLRGITGREDVLTVLGQEFEAFYSSRTLGSFLRLVGMRSGLLYPQQKNIHKRCQPVDRTLEVLVAGTVNMTERVEYRDFLDALYLRWGIVVGGRPEDTALLAESGAPVPSRELRENSARFLHRLEAQGLAVRLADSVAVVGLQEERDA